MHDAGIISIYDTDVFVCVQSVIDVLVINSETLQYKADTDMALGVCFVVLFMGKEDYLEMQI